MGANLTLGKSWSNSRLCRMSESGKIALLLAAAESALKTAVDDVRRPPGDRQGSKNVKLISQRTK